MTLRVPSRLTTGVAALGTATCLIFSLGSAGAHAAERDDDVSSDVSRALVVADQGEAKPNPDVALPKAGSDAAALKTSQGVLELSVPAGRGGAERTDTNERVVDTTSPEASIVMQSTDTGLRSLVHIESAAAPERYTFELGGAVTSLQLAEDGGAIALDANGSIVAVAPAPWAVDSTGAAVPTHFEIENGADLVQVIEHRSGHFSYGIVADPWWNPFSWPWGKWVTKSKKSVAGAFKKCGAGALATTLGLGATTGTTNILIEKTSSTRAFIKVGGWQGYVGVAVGGCIVGALS